MKSNTNQPSKRKTCPLGFNTCAPCRPFIEGQVLPCGIVVDGKPRFEFKEEDQ